MNIASMKKILELKEGGRSDKALRKLYPQYRKDRLEFYRRCVEQGGPVATNIQRVNEGVLRKVREAREVGRPVHGYNMRRWGLELADEYNITAPLREFYLALQAKEEGSDRFT